MNKVITPSSLTKCAQVFTPSLIFLLVHLSCYTSTAWLPISDWSSDIKHLPSFDLVYSWTLLLYKTGGWSLLDYKWSILFHSWSVYPVLKFKRHYCGDRLGKFWLSTRNSNNSAMACENSMVYDPQDPLESTGGRSLFLTLSLLISLRWDYRSTLTVSPRDLLQFSLAHWPTDGEASVLWIFLV